MTHPKMMEPRIDQAFVLADKINDVICDNAPDDEVDLEDVASAVILALAMMMTYSGMDETEGTSFVRRALPLAFRAARTAKRAIN